jgi:sugar O-acyltransferase (sialic acid O-acetyltransferase NeuD family)
MDIPVIIFGAKTLAKTVLDALRSNERTIYCFLDEDQNLHNTEIDHIPVMGSPKDPAYLSILGQKCAAFVAFDDLKESQNFSRFIIKEYSVMPVNALHRTAYLAAGVNLGHGILVGANSSLGFGCGVMDHVRILAGAQIEAEVQIQTGAYIGTGAVVGTKVKIGKGAYLGAGAVIAAGVEIGDFAKVGPGSVVIKSVDEGESVFGVPAVRV